MPTLRRDMSVGLRGDKVGSDYLDENLFQILLVMLLAKLRQGAFGKKFAVVDDADGVAVLFEFAHDLGGEDDGLTVVAAFADERSDGAGGQDVEAVGALIHDHDGRSLTAV